MADHIVLAAPPELARALGPLQHELAGLGRRTTALLVRGDPDELIQALAELGSSAGEPMTVLGYSVAGGFAVRLAVVLSDRVDTLILVSPVELQRSTRHLRKAIRRGAEWEWYVPAHRALSVSRGMAERLARTALAYGDVQSAIPDVSVPVVVVRGAKDPTTSHGWLAAATGRTKDCAYEVAEARHALVAAKPRLVASIISEHSLPLHQARSQA